VVQWNRAGYEGIVEEDGRLTGESFDESEQRTIGAENMLLAQDVNMVPDANTTDNRVQVVPVPTDQDCDAILPRLDSLFD